MELQFTRHAKNRMRKLEMSASDVEAVVLGRRPYDLDLDGRPRYLGRIRGRQVRVVLAVDIPNLVVSLHERRNR